MSPLLEYYLQGKFLHAFLRPLTYLHPTSNTQRVTLADGSEVEVVEVEPTFGT